MAPMSPQRGRRGAPKGGGEGPPKGAERGPQRGRRGAPKGGGEGPLYQWSYFRGMSSDFSPKDSGLRSLSSKELFNGINKILFYIY